MREICIDKLYQKNSKISKEDLTFLRELGKREQVCRRDGDNLGFKEFIAEMVGQCELALAHKKELLSRLVSDYEKLSPEEQQQQKVKFLVWYRQIADNPFEAPVELDKALLGEKFSKFIEVNQATPLRPSKEMLQYKLEGLKRIRDSYPPADHGHPVLIAGAGPGGLMAGLIASMQGKSFRIIESRLEKESATRENILALGKEGSEGKEGSDSLLRMMQGLQQVGQHSQADLRLLDFFGITDRLVANNLAIPPPDGTSIFCASIGDIQRVMVDQIKDVTGQQEVIQYGRAIQEIRRNNGTTEVIIGSSGRKGAGEVGEKVTIQPQSVYVLEGSRSPTRTLLGIEMVKQSTSAKMAFAFFKAKGAKGLRTQFIHKLEVFSEHVRAVPTLFRVAWNVLMAARQGRDQVEAAFQVYDRGSLLLRTPANDYLYYTINAKDEERFKSYENNLEALKSAFEDWRLQIVQDLKSYSDQEDLTIQRALYRLQDPDSFSPENRKDTLGALAEAAKLMSKPTDSTTEKSLQVSNKALQKTLKEIENLESIQIEMQRKMASGPRRLFGLVNPFQGGSSRAAHYQRTDMATSQVQRADRNCQYVGEIPFILCGDAESTTDPLSGGGLRYTLQRTALAASAFERVSQNGFARSVFECASHLGARAMREEGLEMRQRVTKGTERLERYLDAAVDEGVLREEQCQQFLSLHAKFEAGVSLDNDDAAVLKHVLRFLRNSYFGSRDIQTKDVLEWSSNAALTPDESEIIQHVHNAEHERMNGRTYKDLELTPAKMMSLRKAAAKLALVRQGLKDPEKYYVSGAWFFLLATTIEQMLPAPS